MVEDLKQAIDFRTGFLVEAPAERLSSSIGFKQASLFQDVFLDGEESIQPGLELKSHEGTDREVDAVGRFVVALAEGVPDRDHGGEEFHAGHRARDASPETVDQGDSARALEDAGLAVREISQY